MSTFATVTAASFAVTAADTFAASSPVTSVCACAAGPRPPVPVPFWPEPSDEPDEVGAAVAAYPLTFVVVEPAALARAEPPSATAPAAAIATAARPNFLGDIMGGTSR